MSTMVAYIAASQFFCLAKTAAAHGGFWVSCGGGTANVVAGEISRICNVSYEEAHRVLNSVGEQLSNTDNWYQHLADIQPSVDIFDDNGFRWDARTVARAACRAALKAQKSNMLNHVGFIRS